MLHYGFLKLCTAVSIYKAPSWKLKCTDSWESFTFPAVWKPVRLRALL